MAGVAWRLAVLRKTFDLTQVTLGQTLGVGDTAVANYEKASRLISPYDAFKLKIAYGIPLEWLYAADESTLPSPLAARLRIAEVALRKDRQKAKPKRRRA